MAVFVVIVLSAVSVLADYFLKRATLTSSGMTSVWFWVAALIYGTTAFGWFYALKYMKLANLGGVYAVTTILLLVIVVFGVFKEDLTNREVAGIVMAIASLLLLNRFA